MLSRPASMLLLASVLLLGVVVWQLGAQTPPAPLPPPGEAQACPSEVSKAYTQLVTEKVMQPNAAALGWAVQLSTVLKEFSLTSTLLGWARTDLQAWQRNAAQLADEIQTLRRANAELMQAQQLKMETPPPPAN